MALHWNVEEIADREGRAHVWRPDPNAGPEAVRLHGPLDCLIWLSMICGFDRITEANAVEVYARVHAFEGIAGPISTSREPVTWLDVWQARGLRTNASTLTPASFKAKLWHEAKARAERTAEWHRKQHPEHYEDEAGTA